MTKKEKAVKILADSIMLKGWFTKSGAEAMANGFVDEMVKAGVITDGDYRGDNSQFDILPHIQQLENEGGLVV